MQRPPLLDDTFPLALDAPFTRRMAHDAGLTDKQLRGLVANNLLRHPIQNVYVPAQAPDDISMRIAALQARRTRRLLRRRPDRSMAARRADRRSRPTTTCSRPRSPCSSTPTPGGYATNWREAVSARCYHGT